MKKSHKNKNRKKITCIHVLGFEEVNLLPFHITAYLPKIQNGRQWPPFEIQNALEACTSVGMFIIIGFRVINILLPLTLVILLPLSLHL